MLHPIWKSNIVLACRIDIFSASLSEEIRKYETKPYNTWVSQSQELARHGSFSVQGVIHMYLEEAKSAEVTA